MNMILDGMTREEALGCVWVNADGVGIFIRSNKMYFNPFNCEQYAQVPRPVEQMRAAINKHYDALDAEEKKGKWKDVYHRMSVRLPTNKNEYFYSSSTAPETDAEIARTNARREIEAFIRENGGPSSKYGSCFVLTCRNGVLGCEAVGTSVVIGVLCCATRELADEVIRRYPEQLALLKG
jgi:hypothetical protein